jgi:cation diffusion facilitator CzcD-associated flavoprotein CzcO
MTLTPETANTPAESRTDVLDLVVIGAGISGIGAAYHLGQHTPGARYVVLERRARIGGIAGVARLGSCRSSSVRRRRLPARAPPAIACV